MKYLDIHTHKERDDLRNYQVLSHDIRSVLDIGYIENGPFTLGIHPWYIDEVVLEDAYQMIQDSISKKMFLGIGEAGIDRTIKTSIAEQEEVFKTQVLMAKENDIPCMIIHCVKAFPEIIKIVRSVNYCGQIIFHDYNGPPSTTSSLLRENVYFSYGDKLFNEDSGGHRSFMHIPKERILLETDDMADKQIEDIYAKASVLLKMGTMELALMIQKNASMAFSKILPLSVR